MLYLTDVIFSPLTDSATAIRTMNGTMNGGTAFWENYTYHSNVSNSVVVSQTLSTAFQVAYVSIGAVGIIGNLLSLVVLLGHAPLRRSSANYFTTNQTFIDLLASIVLIPSFFVGVDRFKGALACYFWRPRTVFLGLFMASLFNITALAVERYIKVVHPVKHRNWVTRKRLLLVVVGVSVSGFLLKMPYVFGGVSIRGDGSCIVRSFPTATIANVSGTYNFLLEFLLPLLIIAFCYIQITRSLSRRRSVQPGAPATVNPGNLAKAGARRNGIKTLFYVVLVFLICTSFKNVLVLFQMISGIPFSAGDPTFNGAQLLSFIVCCTNPFIYSFHYEEFKVGLRKVVLRKQTQSAVGQTVDQEVTAPRNKF